MSFQLHPARALDAEIRRIGCRQIDKALAELSDTGHDPDAAIHGVRKRLKKLRGLLRLADTGAHALVRAENRRWRDTARPLSALRDRAALVEALGELEERFAGEVATDAFAVVRGALEHRREAPRQDAAEREAVIQATLAALGKGRQAVENFTLPFRRHRDQRAVAEAGARKTFARARHALARAARTHRADDLHELRKQMKYHAMHLKLLGRVWPDALDPLRTAAEAIAEDLGRDHDYAVLRAQIAEQPEAFGPRADLEVVLAFVDHHQSELRERALAQARRLLAERPAAFRRRLAKLYDLAAAQPDPGAPVEAPDAGRRRAH